MGYISTGIGWVRHKEQFLNPYNKRYSREILTRHNSYNKMLVGRDFWEEKGWVLGTPWYDKKDRKYYFKCYKK